MIVAALTAPLLVDAAWLHEHRADVVVIDTRRAGEFLDGHVPGAVSFQLGSLLVENTTRTAMVALGQAAQEALAARGVTAEDHVVLVDDGDGSAAVGTFVCELAGVRSVSTLHGGVRAWQTIGAQLETAPARSSHEAATFQGDVCLDTVATFEDLVDAGRLGVRLVDARSQLEHEGIVGPPCCPYRGHIPGSLNLEWSHLLAATGDLQQRERVLAEARHLGLREDEEIIVYCHSGHRAAVAAVALRSAGFTKVRHSFGSWHEWSHRGLVGGLEA